MSATGKTSRIVFLDWLRVIACLMVMTVHASEAIYSNDYSFSFASETERWSVCLINGLMRPAVPLFLIASAYLLVPLRTSSSVFFKKRFSRVVIPFVIWLFAYACLPALWGEFTVGEMKANLASSFINFIPRASHLWFIYMLLGIYLIMPIISPWLEKVGKREELFFLGIWFFTTFFWHLHEKLGNVFGECWWNPYPLFYYVSGYVGYVVMAHYIRTYINWSKTKTIIVGAGCLLAGYAFCVYSFYTNSFVVDEVRLLELSWQTTSFAPALMSFGAFLLIRLIKSTGEKLYRGVLEISKMTYGMYLMHMLILPFVFSVFYPVFPAPITIFATAIVTYIISFLITKAISMLPFGKYIVG